MAVTLGGRAWAWVRSRFPERQIYIRSDGRVQFFTFGPILQASLVVMTFGFLGWVAFASVQVVFKERIIAAKDERYREMQGAYESRIAGLQLSYDELNGALVAAEDRFRSVADELEAKQASIAGLLERKQALENSGFGAGVQQASLAPLAERPRLFATNGETPGGSELLVLPNAVEPHPRTSRPPRATFLDSAVETLGALFGAKAKSSPTRALDHPVLKQLAAEEARLRRLAFSQHTLLARAEEDLTIRVERLQGVLRVAGFQPNVLVGRVSKKASAVGGPLIPMQSVPREIIRDPVFESRIVRVAARLKELDDVIAALHAVPLALPVRGGDFEASSDFGPRVDPFTKRLAFHAGIDFTGPWGSDVHATAPGVVTWAGPRGPYGRLVEIDHGFGLKTRYAHLRSISVKTGDKVAKGATVGRLGSTGRSTGPHLHYEVWFDDVVRDPSKFIEAGRYVLKE